MQILYCTRLMGIMKSQIENLNQSVAALAPVHHFLLCGQLHDDPHGIMNKLFITDGWISMSAVAVL